MASQPKGIRRCPSSWVTGRIKMKQRELEPVIVIGAGGHAKVVISTLEAAGHKVTAVYDDDHAKFGADVLGVPVRGALAELGSGFRGKAIIAIGDNATRVKVARQFEEADWVTVVHPAAYVHHSSRLGAGTVVFAGAVIQPCASVGAHVIVNTGATVDHDCVIDDFVHVAPGTNLAGGVKIGQGAFLGIGSAVIPYCSVGEWATVGAGAVVIYDLPADVTAVGVPASPVRRIKNKLRAIR
jgi:sugar O-acyltransferase (sialic acid O-acetyltransferase NeuD family)